MTGISGIAARGSMGAPTGGSEALADTPKPDVDRDYSGSTGVLSIGSLVLTAAAGGFSIAAAAQGRFGMLGGLAAITGVAALGTGIAALAKLNGQQERAYDAAVTDVLGRWDEQEELPGWISGDDVLEHVLSERHAVTIGSNVSDEVKWVAPMAVAVRDSKHELDDLEGFADLAGHAFDPGWNDTARVIEAAAKSDRSVEESIQVMDWSRDHHGADEYTAATLIESDLSTAEIIRGD